MAKDYFSDEYSEWLRWVDKRLEKGWSWEKISMCGKEDEAGLLAYLANQDPDDYYPFTLEEWREFIAIKKEHEENARPIEEMILGAESGVDDLDAPQNKNSAWVMYKKSWMEIFREQQSIR